MSTNPRIVGVPAPAAPSSDLIGKTIKSQYEILEKLGEGGFGAVYRGREATTKREVAIKHLTLKDNVEARARFKREGLVVASLSHPNIVQVIEYVENELGCFIIMEYLKGKTLDKMLREFGALSDGLVRVIMEDVFTAIQFCHDNGVVHRDIKAENVMIQQFGDKYVAKVLDYGVARVTDDRQDKKEIAEIWQTRAIEGGALPVIGTLYYLAPELQSGKPADAASDVYALAVLVYYMLTGELPFEEDMEAIVRAVSADGHPGVTGLVNRKIQEQVLVMHMFAPPPPISRKRPTVSRELAEAVMKGLAKNPQDRWQSAVEFKRALRKALPSGANLSMHPPRTSYADDQDMLGEADAIPLRRVADSLSVTMEAPAASLPPVGTPAVQVILPPSGQPTVPEGIAAPPAISGSVDVNLGSLQPPPAAPAPARKSLRAAGGLTVVIVLVSCILGFWSFWHELTKPSQPVAEERIAGAPAPAPAEVVATAAAPLPSPAAAPANATPARSAASVTASAASAGAKRPGTADVEACFRNPRSSKARCKAVCATCRAGGLTESYCKAACTLGGK